MDIQQLLNQFLGGSPNQDHSNNNTGTSTDNTNETSIADKAKKLAQQATQSGLGGFAGGAIAGGLLTLLFSNSKARNVAGTAIGYGGAAVLGAMAHKAYQNYQAGKLPTEKTSISQQDIDDANNKFIPATITSASGKPFSMTLIKGMIMAAKSDGHIDPVEQKNIFAEIEKLKLPASDKALILDVLTQPIDLIALANETNNQEQAAELYLISRLAVNPDQPDEQTYLANLASTLKLPAELVAHLNRQAES